MQEEAAFRRTLETYLRAPANTSPAQRAALLDDIARRADRLAFVYQPADVRDIPGVIIARLPIYCPPKKPDRDVQIVLTALDHCDINLSANLLGRSNRTVSDIADMARESILRDAARQLGPHFTAPPTRPALYRPAP